MMLGPISVKRLAMLCAGLGVVGFWAWFSISGELGRFERNARSRGAYAATMATASERGVSFVELQRQADLCGVNLRCRDQALYNDRLDQHVDAARNKDLLAILVVMAACSAGAFIAAYLLAYLVRFLVDRFWPWLTGR